MGSLARRTTVFPGTSGTLGPRASSSRPQRSAPEWVGDCVRPGLYRVEARFRRSVLLADGRGGACFVVNREIGRGPLNLTVEDPLGWVGGAEGTEVRVGRGMLERAERWDSRMPEGADAAAVRWSLEEGLERVAPAESLVSVFTGRAAGRWERNRDAVFRAALERGAAGDLVGMARAVKGCGQGLTPSGDDFLAGAMLGLRLRGRGGQRRILRAALGGNVVSNAFLRVAARGRVNEAVQAWLEAPEAAGRLERAAAFGHTSGADLLCGMRWGLGF